MLDNVLDATHWPLANQQQEAMNKRRVGLGFTGLGDALYMLTLRYDSQEALAMAAKISEHMRDTAYLTSVDLATKDAVLSRCSTPSCICRRAATLCLASIERRQSRNPQARPA